MTRQLSPATISKIEQALRSQAKAFREYDRYPSFEFKQQQLAENAAATREFNEFVAAMADDS